MAAFGYEITRCADDFVIQCRTAEAAAAALEMVRVWTTERGLSLHPTKTKIVHVDADGFEFPGDRFIKHRPFPRKKRFGEVQGSDSQQDETDQRQQSASDHGECEPDITRLA